jgi:hypothetical protein
MVEHPKNIPHNDKPIRRTKSEVEKGFLFGQCQPRCALDLDGMRQYIHHHQEKSVRQYFVENFKSGISQTNSFSFLLLVKNILDTRSGHCVPNSKDIDGSYFKYDESRVYTSTTDMHLSFFD